ncbi:MAG TPA: YcxB family protein [Chthoniobacteraceae bacterium]|nr:YcxB family protein [Chthoniobacteraceae bacterium]
MEIRYELTPADMRAFIAYNRKHSPQVRRLRYISVGFIALVCLSKAWELGRDTTAKLVIFAVSFAAGCVVMWILNRVLRAILEWRSHTPEQRPGLYCQHTIALSEKELIETTEVNEGRHSWKGVLKVVETPRHIFIYVGPNAAHTIPKRAFPDAASARGFFEQAVKFWEMRG